MTFKGLFQHRAFYDSMIQRLSLGVTAPMGAAFQPAAQQVEPGEWIFPCLGIP